ncbi:MAG: hypothetical protein CMH04_00735 [Marinovum sp.]|nr:hypothetical protein [Marinovum sp.]|tara:strand:+ start:3246 stop:3704 length:459 start_codon:yes stop_codon:yes gene_type:complete
MSTMYVNKVQELNVGSGVQIPGHVVQVVEAEGSGIIYFGASTSSYTTLITLNITPKFNNSLIHVHYFQTLNTTTGHWGTRVQRNGSTLVITGEGQSNTGRINAVGFKLDNPATTSQVTYTLQGIASSGATDSNLYTVNNPTGGGMIAMEIAQ